MSGVNDRLRGLSVKLFADGADLAHIRQTCRNPLIEGFTTNPTLMREAGVEDYRSFGQEVLEIVPDRPVCIEVLADDHKEMARQARAIQSWGRNVYVKVPVTNTRGESSLPMVRSLVEDGVQVNITAVFTLEQVREAALVLKEAVPAYVSVFAGRLADAGVDPIPVMREAAEILEPLPHAELIWASPREVLNVLQADACGCHVITLTGGLIAKLDLIGKDLEAFSLETVKMFYDDAVAAGYSSEDVVSEDAA
jgi:transaldolase